MDEKVERIHRELKYKGAILDMYEDTIQVPGGKTAKWDYLHHKGAAAVVPVMDDGKILMVRQYRNAIDRYTLEIPAGAVDYSGEPGIICAARELEEETGYKSDNLQKLVKLCTAIAFCDEFIEIFVASDLVPSKQNLDEDEFIDVKAYTIEELKEKIFSWEIQDSKTVAALMAYDAKYNHSK